MKSEQSFWERAFPPDDAPQGWRRWIALDPEGRSEAIFWKKIRNRLAKAGITVEAATDDEVRAAIKAHDDLIDVYVNADDRAVWAVELRKQGKTFRQIGLALGGVCPERARQIEARGERIALSRARAAPSR